MKVYIRNKIISLRGSSTVVDENQQSVFVVKGKFFTLHNTKKICDASGKLLYKLKNRLINLWAHKVRIYDAGGKKVCAIKDKVVTLKPVFFIEGTSEDYKIEGEFFSLSCQILRNGQPIGTIRRQITLIKDAFELEASEADMPFCLALVIALDNITDAKTNTR